VLLMIPAIPLHTRPTRMAIRFCAACERKPLPILADIPPPPVA